MDYSDRKIPEAGRVDPARLDGHPGTWCDRIDVLQAGGSGKHPLGGLNDLNGVAVGPGGDTLDPEQCLVLTGEDQPRAVHREVQRSVADPVSDEQDSAAVVNGAGELSGDLLEALDTESGAQLQQKSGIVVGREGALRAPRDQGGQFCPIIDRAIKNDVCAFDSLEGCRRPAHAEMHQRRNGPLSGSRSSMCQTIAQSLQL